MPAARAKQFLAGRLPRFPPLRQGPSHQNYTLVYAIGLLLPAIVGIGLFLMTGPAITQTAFSAPVGATAHANGTQHSRPTPSVIPTSTAIPVIDALVSVPDHLATVTAVATAVGTTTFAFVEVTPSPPIPGRVLIGHVGNTQGDGVFLRHTPRLTDRWIAWVDGTPLVMLGGEQDGDGQHWLKVRDPKNNIGWVPAQFVLL